MKSSSALIRSGLYGIAFAAATSDIVFAQTPSPDRGYGHFHGHGMMWGGGPFGMFLGALFMILMVIAIIAGAIFLMRSFGVAGMSNARDRSTQSENKALDILKERFAKGEIDAKEFDERKRLLSE